MEILFDEIPSLDLADFTAGSPEKKAEFVRKLGEAYQNIGFVAIKTTSPDSLNHSWHTTPLKFFSKSLNSRKRIHRSDNL